MTAKEKKWLEYGGGGLLVLIVLWMVTNHPSNKPAPTAPKTQDGRNQRYGSSTPNPGSPATEQAYYSARATALAAYDASVGSLVGTINTNAAQTRQTQLVTSSETAQARIQAASAQAIAASEAAAQEQVAQTQASAAQNVAQAQQPQWWQSLLGAIPGIGSLFGFSNPGGMGGFNPFGWFTGNPNANPISYGSASVTFPDIYLPNEWNFQVPEPNIPFPTTIGG